MPKNTCLQFQKTTKLKRNKNPKNHSLFSSSSQWKKKRRNLSQNHQHSQQQNRSLMNNQRKLQLQKSHLAIFRQTRNQHRTSERIVRLSAVKVAKKTRIKRLTSLQSQRKQNLSQDKVFSLDQILFRLSSKISRSNKRRKNHRLTYGSLSSHLIIAEASLKQALLIILSSQTWRPLRQCKRAALKTW